MLFTGLTDGLAIGLAPEFHAYVYGAIPPEAAGLPPIVTLVPPQIFWIGLPALTVGIEFTLIDLVAVAVHWNWSVTVTA